MPSDADDLPAVCHTCRHGALVHRAHSRCLACDCGLYVAVGSPRAVLREAAADLDWTLTEREMVDDFRRGDDWVTVVFSPFDRILAATTPQHYGTDISASRIALDHLLAAPALAECGRR